MPDYLLKLHSLHYGFEGFYYMVEILHARVLERVPVPSLFKAYYITLVWVLFYFVFFFFCGCCSVPGAACLACVCVRLMIMRMVLLTPLMMLILTLLMISCWC